MSMSEVCKSIRRKVYLRQGHQLKFVLPYKLYFNLWGVILCLVLCCCDNTNNKRLRIEKELAIFERQKICIPDDMLCILDGKVNHQIIRHNFPTLIVYLDSEECFSCASKHLYDYDILFDNLRWDYSFETLIIFSPDIEGQGKVLKEVIQSHYKFPIYIDISKSFAELNKSIPKDRIFHTFLVDASCYPILVGDPIISDKVKELFVSSLSGLYE